MKNYKVFTRNWWKANNETDDKGNLLWPKGLEPDGNARKNFISWAATEEEAREICKQKNELLVKNRLGKMAEYTKVK
tara:strand:- start:94 stop:324 length:231 start_codon:yes stop_codon:yes gene_type:complete